jgi:hypothetical protein
VPKRAETETEGSWAANNSRLVSQWSQEREQLQGGWAPEDVAAASASAPPATGGVGHSGAGAGAGAGGGGMYNAFQPGSGDSGGMDAAFQGMPAGFQAASPGGGDTGMPQWDLGGLGGVGLGVGDLGVGLQPGLPEEGGPGTGTWKDLGDMVMGGLDFLDSPDSNKGGPQAQLGMDIGLAPARLPAATGMGLPEPAPEPEPPPGKRKSDLIDFLEALNIPQFLPLFTRNELDLSALMLCTDDDLKEIGIPKGPRVKLRNGAIQTFLSSRRCF